MNLYMAVTTDELELPLYVADNALDLANKFGLKIQTMYCEISRPSKSTRRGYKFIRIELNDEG